jgi:uncharacterized phage-associated protein
MRGFNYKKAIQALNFIAVNSGGTANKMKAIKLIWLTDRLHLRRYGRTITGDHYFALKHGPVPSTTKDLLQKNPFLDEDEAQYMDEYLRTDAKYDYSSGKELNPKVFSKSDLLALEEVLKHYGKYDQYALRDISHRFPEWKRWEAKLKSQNTRFEMDFHDFFKSGEIDSPLFNEDTEELELTQSLFFRTEKPQSDALDARGV